MVVDQPSPSRPALAQSSSTSVAARASIPCVRSHTAAEQAHLARERHISEDMARRGVPPPPVTTP
eukprot:4468661-Amphidinium_carterae.1